MFYQTLQTENDLETFAQACLEDKPLGLGVHTMGGNVTCEGVANSLGYDYVPVENLF